MFTKHIITINAIYLLQMNKEYRILTTQINTDFSESWQLC